MSRVINSTIQENKVGIDELDGNVSKYTFHILYDKKRIDIKDNGQKNKLRSSPYPKGISYDSDEIIGRVIKAYFQGVRLTTRGLRAFDSKLLMSLEGRFQDQNGKKPFESVSELREKVAEELEQIEYPGYAQEVRAYNKNFCNHKKKWTKEKLIDIAITSYVDNSIDIDEGEIKKTKQGRKFISAIHRRGYKMQEFRQEVASKLEEQGRFQQAKKLKEHTKSPYNKDILIYEGARLARQGVQLSSGHLKKIYLPFANIISRQIKRNGKYEPLFFKSWNEFRQEVASKLQKEGKTSLVNIVKKQNKSYWSKKKIIEDLIDFNYYGYDLSSKSLKQNLQTHDLWVAITSYKNGKAKYFGRVSHALKAASEQLYEKRKINDALRVLDFIGNKKQRQELKQEIREKCNDDSERIYRQIFRRYKEHKNNTDFSEIRHPSDIQLYKRDVNNFPLLDEKERFSLFYMKNNPFYPEEIREKAREIIINCNLRLVLKEAYKYTNRRVSLTNLISDGNIGLIKAVEEFDYFGRAAFSTYACPKIKKQIKKAYTEEILDNNISYYRYRQLGKLNEIQIKYKRRASKEQVMEKMDLSEKTFENLMSVKKLIRKKDIEPSLKYGEEERDIPYASKQKTPEEILIEKEEQEKAKNYLENYLSNMPPRDAEVVKMRMGYGYEPMTLKEISKTLPVISDGRYEELTKERVRQIILKYSWLVDKKAG